MEEPEIPPSQTTAQTQPSPSAGHSRRTVVKLAVVCATGAAAGAGSAAIITHRGQAAPPLYRFFSEAEGALLIAICEQIIPRDDAPGATDAGVIHYIDRQLSGVLARHQQTYRVGLESFRRTCLDGFKMPFAELPTNQQIAALKLIESGQAQQNFWPDPSATPASLAPGRSPSPRSSASIQREFFNLVIDHTMQGFYGSPRHGGNRDYTSYRMLGLAYPNLIGQNRYATKQP